VGRSGERRCGFQALRKKRRLLLSEIDCPEKHNPEAYRKPTRENLPRQNHPTGKSMCFCGREKLCKLVQAIQL